MPGIDYNVTVDPKPVVVLTGAEQVPISGGTNTKTTTQAIAALGGPVKLIFANAYTFSASDNGGYTRFNSAVPVVLTIAPETVQPMPNNAVLTIEQAGAGAVTFTAAAGTSVTLLPPGKTLGTSGPNAVISAKRVAPNTWVVFGNLAA